MPWSKHAEMAMVQRRELRLVESLDDGQDCCVHEADVGIRVAIAQRADARIVDRSHVLDGVGPCSDVVQETDEDAGVEMSGDQVVDLDEDW